MRQITHECQSAPTHHKTPRPSRSKSYTALEREHVFGGGGSQPTPPGQGLRSQPSPTSNQAKYAVDDTPTDAETEKGEEKNNTTVLGTPWCDAHHAHAARTLRRAP